MPVINSRKELISALRELDSEFDNLSFDEYIEQMCSSKPQNEKLLKTIFNFDIFCSDSDEFTVFCDTKDERNEIVKKITELGFRHFFTFDIKHAETPNHSIGIRCSNEDVKISHSHNAPCAIQFKNEIRQRLGDEKIHLKYLRSEFNNLAYYVGTREEAKKLEEAIQSYINTNPPAPRKIQDHIKHRYAVDVTERHTDEFVVEIKSIFSLKFGTSAQPPSCTTEPK
ncbi:hypothetical protein [Photobacterium kishitanii]|uniref:Uncharacterized protein n=1 Tax=Photobacterium kishitanii TaxID=318456 RepID=A0A2T3KKY5_9GAMM|nr:hypothetical protein [Photobacterium kishitanii]PSV00319.1 hypothetical protein C9J27_04125 [Photobacterium kishitanii]